MPSTSSSWFFWWTRWRPNSLFPQKGSFGRRLRLSLCGQWAPSYSESLRTVMAAASRSWQMWSSFPLLNCSADLLPTTLFLLFFAAFTASAWEANGGSELHWPWKVCLPGCAEFFLESCRADIRLDTCWRPSQHDLCCPTWAGVPCSGWAAFLRCWLSTYAQK